jgi:hypothetical protein
MFRIIQVEYHVHYHHYVVVYHGGHDWVCDFDDLHDFIDFESHQSHMIHRMLNTLSEYYCEIW